jgi:hypothetical protein
MKGSDVPLRLYVPDISDKAIKYPKLVPLKKYYNTCKENY